jgi:predicted Zn finger-like uncharacterized protein
MLIVCPQCTTSYQVAPASLGADGRSVRCVNCQTIWFATAQQSMLEDATAGHGFDSYDPGQDATAFETPVSGPSGDDPNDFDVTVSDRLPSENDGGAADIPSFANMAAIPDDPAVIGDSPSIVPPAADDGASIPFTHVLPGEDIESLAARRQAEQDRHRFWRRLKMPTLPTLIVALAGVVFVLLVARNQVVQYAPQTASLYAALGMPVNLRGLDFENIRVTRDQHEGVPVMVVEGKIANTNNRIVEVPRLRFAIHDQTGKEIYTWTMMPSRTLLAAGETLPFRSRLASPPAEGKDVSIRFFNRRDVMTGFR